MVPPIFTLIIIDILINFTIIAYFIRVFIEMVYIMLMIKN